MWTELWNNETRIFAQNIIAQSKSIILESLTGKFSLQTHRSYHPNRSHLGIAASPHPPVVVLSLLQQVLMASEVFLLVAHPAAAAGRGAGVRKMCISDYSAIALAWELFDIGLIVLLTSLPGLSGSRCCAWRPSASGPSWSWSLSCCSLWSWISRWSRAFRKRPSEEKEWRSGGQSSSIPHSQHFERINHGGSIFHTFGSLVFSTRGSP